MNVISITVNAFLTDIFCNHWDELPTSILRHLARVINYDTIPDRLISDNEEIRNVILWNKLNKMTLMRVLVRCIDQNVEDLENIKKNLYKYDYKVKDLTFLLMRRPEFIEFFPIDLNKISTVEAAMLLAIGNEYFLDKIDMSKHTFNFRESMNIIQGYKYRRSIVEQVNYKSLKGYQIAEILINTGERDLDILDISTLTNIDWINLLESRPEMLKYCNFSKFMEGDIFYSIKLCCMFDSPDLTNLVLSRKMDDISPLGWEMLLIEKPEIFLAHCNFSKLEDVNWNYIIKSRPELSSYKP
jgi:hypothetical protein